MYDINHSNLRRTDLEYRNRRTNRKRTHCTVQRRTASKARQIGKEPQNVDSIKHFNRTRDNDILLSLHLIVNIVLLWRLGLTNL